jgi:hypothetical protein
LTLRRDADVDGRRGRQMLTSHPALATLTVTVPKPLAVAHEEINVIGRAARAVLNLELPPEDVSCLSVLSYGWRDGNLTTHSTRPRDSISFIIELFHNLVCCSRGRLVRAFGGSRKKQKRC